MKMTSKKNLTRFTYENAAFEGWRLNINRAGQMFTKYFSDKKHGGSQKSFEAASETLEKVKDIIDNSRRVKGKLSQATIKKANGILKKA